MEKEKITFEDGVKQLEDVVARLNAGNLPLDEMVKLYEKGDALAKHCLKLLDEYDARLDMIDGVGKAE